MHGVTRYTTVATISEGCHAACHYSFTAFTWSLLDGTAHRGSFVILYNLAELVIKNKCSNLVSKHYVSRNNHGMQCNTYLI